MIMFNSIFKALQKDEYLFDKYKELYNFENKNDS